MKTEAEYFEQRGLPVPGVKPHEQVIHGLRLPLHLARALFADPMAKRRYLRVCILQFLVILGLGLLFMQSEQVAADVDDRAEDAPLPVPVPPLPPLPPAPREDAERALQEGAAVAKVAKEELKAGRVLEAARHAKVAARQFERAETLRARMRSFRQRWRKATVTDLEFWAALLAAMHITQWVVIALSRDYHDAIARDVSLLTRLEPEDGPAAPRIRLNVPWLRTKMKRRWRALLLFLMGAPLLWLATLPLPGGSALFTVLMSVWGAWWYVVFTAAKSGRAWRDEAAPAPLFLRFWTWLTTRVPGFRWALPRRYGSGLEKLTRPIYSPVACVERQPWAYAGLALLRAVGLIPGLKVFVRPLIPVASAHLLEARQAAAPVEGRQRLLSAEPASIPSPPGSGPG